MFEKHIDSMFNWPIRCCVIEIKLLSVFVGRHLNQTSPTQPTLLHRIRCNSASYLSGGCHIQKEVRSQITMRLWRRMFWLFLLMLIWIIMSLLLGKYQLTPIWCVCSILEKSLKPLIPEKLGTPISHHVSSSMGTLHWIWHGRWWMSNQLRRQRCKFLFCHSQLVTLFTLQSPGTGIRKGQSAACLYCGINHALCLA